MPEDTTESITIENHSALIVDATHSGSSNFMVDLLEVNSGDRDSLINAQGNIDGRIVAEVIPGRYVFNVTYDESYSLTPTEIDQTDILLPPVAIDGSDFEVLPVELTGPSQFQMEVATDSNVVLTLRRPNGEFIRRPINDHSSSQFATTLTDEGVVLFCLELVDQWSVEIEEL